MYLPRDPAALADLTKRFGYGYGCDPYYDNCNSAWHRWGRWVLAGVLIFIGILIVLFFLFCGARRRRHARRTAAPMTSQTGYNQEYNQGYNQGYNQQYSAPPGPPPTYGNERYDGYYGQQGGLTQPPNTYKP